MRILFKHITALPTPTVRVRVLPGDVALEPWHFPCSVVYAHKPSYGSLSLHKDHLILQRKRKWHIASAVCGRWLRQMQTIKLAGDRSIFCCFTQRKPKVMGGSHFTNEWCVGNLMEVNNNVLLNVIIINVIWNDVNDILKMWSVLIRIKSISANQHSVSGKALTFSKKNWSKWYNLNHFDEHPHSNPRTAKHMFSNKKTPRSAALNAASKWH